jgi:hypothetical protein
VQCVNEKIAALVAVKPLGGVYAAFSVAAHLATEAIEAAEELQEMPGVDIRAFQCTLDFWHRVRDYNHAAALACAGGNQTLAVPFRENLPGTATMMPQKDLLRRLPKDN